MFIFVALAYRQRISITDIVVQRHAIVIRNKMTDFLTNEQQKYRLEKSLWMERWADNFVNHHWFRSVSLSGEAISVDAATFAAEMTEIRSNLCDYDLDYIFNVDVMGLFYRLLPRRIYVWMHEDRRNVRGTKAMKAKYRVTAYICTNANGLRVSI